MGNTEYFFLFSVNSGFGTKYDQDAPNTIVGTERVLSDCYTNVQMLYKFRLSGEAQVSAVAETSSFTSLDAVFTKLRELGPARFKTAEIRYFFYFLKRAIVSRTRHSFLKKK